jgi:hypothetical protein
MKTHIHFNDDGEPTSPPTYQAPPTQLLLADVVDSDCDTTVNNSDSNDGSDDDDSWVPLHMENEDSEQDEYDFDEAIDYTSSTEDEDEDEDEEAAATVRSHAPSSSRFRTYVDMEEFRSLCSHLEILLGLKAPEITTLIGRVAEFIGWTMHTNNINQKKAVDRIVNTHPMGVLQYVTLLKGPEYGLKNGTIYNTLLDIGRWAKYLSIYEELTVDRLLIVLTEQQKFENKKKKQDIRFRLSRENLIDKNHWPKNGIQELSNMLMKSKGRVDRAIQKGSNGEYLSDEALSFAKDWVVSLLFVINPQGRSNAIRRLTVEESKQLCVPGGQGQVTSTHFKTSMTYGSQAVNCNPVTQEYITGYTLHIRPYLLKASETDVLFLNLKGMPHQDIGVCVTRLFHQISKYHITTTVLRSMFETEAAEAKDRGIVTDEEMTCVARNSGHSSTTSHNYYQKRKAEHAGIISKEVHKRLYDQCIQPPQFYTGSDPAYVPYQGSTSDEDDLQPRRRRRKDWTTDELSHLTAWATQFELTRGRGTAKDWRACLKAMAATDAFHSLHLTTTALREAWRREGNKAKARKASL